MKFGKVNGEQMLNEKNQCRKKQNSTRCKCYFKRCAKSKKLINGGFQKCVTLKIAFNYSVYIKFMEAFLSNYFKTSGLAYRFKLQETYISSF